VKDYTCEFCGDVFQADTWGGDTSIGSGIYTRTCGRCSAKLIALVAYVEARRDASVAENKWHEARENKPVQVAQ